MKISVDSQEFENLIADVYHQLDAIIFNGIELTSCKQSSRCDFLRHNIEARVDFVNGLVLALKRLGLRSVVRSLIEEVRKRLNRDRSGYQYKIDTFAFSCVQEILN